MKENIEHDIQSLLFDMGIPTHLLGFLYLSYALILVLGDFEYVAKTSKRLYVDIAARYKTEPQSVERCIRHAIAITFTRDRNEFMYELFSTYNKTPSPSQFISRIYFYMINNEKEA